MMRVDPAAVAAELAPFMKTARERMAEDPAFVERAARAFVLCEKIARGWKGVGSKAWEDIDERTRHKVGELNKRARILARQDQPSGGFDVVETYPLVAPRWAKREPVGGAVYVGSAQVGNAITHRIFIRRLAGLGTSHVVDCEGRRHAVKRVTDLNGEGRFTVLEVEELGPVPAEVTVP